MLQLGMHSQSLIFTRALIFPYRCIVESTKKHVDPNAEKGTKVPPVVGGKNEETDDATRRYRHRYTAATQNYQIKQISWP